MLAEKLAKVKGMKFKSWGRTITEGDFSAMNNLCWTIDWIHADRDRMRETTIFKDRLLPGPCTLAIIAGFMFTTPIYQTFTDSGIGIIALLTMEDINFEAPVYPGDTLRSELEIVDSHITSKKVQGIIKIRDVALKHTGEIVCTMTRVFLVQELVA